MTGPAFSSAATEMARLLRRLDFHGARAGRNPDVGIFSERSSYGTRSKAVEISGDTRCVSLWLSGVANQEFETNCSKSSVERQDHNPYWGSLSSASRSRNEHRQSGMTVSDIFKIADEWVIR